MAWFWSNGRKSCFLFSSISLEWDICKFVGAWRWCLCCWCFQKSLSWWDHLEICICWARLGQGRPACICKRGWHWPTLSISIICIFCFGFLNSHGKCFQLYICWRHALVGAVLPWSLAYVSYWLMVVNVANVAILMCILWHILCHIHCLGQQMQCNLKTRARGQTRERGVPFSFVKWQQSWWLYLGCLLDGSNNEVGPILRLGMIMLVIWSICCWLVV